MRALRVKLGSRRTRIREICPVVSVDESARKEEETGSSGEAKNSLELNQFLMPTNAHIRVSCNPPAQDANVRDLCRCVRRSKRVRGKRDRVKRRKR